jgi:hypothetical protein
MCGCFVRHYTDTRHYLQTPLGQQLPHHAPLRGVGAATK